MVFYHAIINSLGEVKFTVNLQYFRGRELITLIPVASVQNDLAIISWLKACVSIHGNGGIEDGTAV
jgi:hypothetical protein